MTKKNPLANLPFRVRLCDIIKIWLYHVIFFVYWDYQSFTENNQINPGRVNLWVGVGGVMDTSKT